MDYAEMIERAHAELIAALPREFSPKEVSLVERSFELAREAHSHQTRKSGHPYILHPLAVAMIVVVEMRQKNADIIAAALLHDVVEDTPHTLEEIEDLFGKDVAYLVGAVTKPNKQQVDNFKHILGSIKGDIRVLILKLADRLNNMRTLSSMRPQKQWKIASETQFFFAPLAGRLGLYKIKSELENLAFSFLNPGEYEYISKALEEDKDRTKEAVESFISAAAQTVRDEFGDCVRWDIRYRKPYSIYREMRDLGCNFYHVPFKHYIRAVFDLEELRQTSGFLDISERGSVLKIYEALSSVYREQTGSFVNYMTQPKANGYRSLHVRFLNPFGGIEEFHISSSAMREQSYFGCTLENQEQWLNRFTEVLNEISEDSDSVMLNISDSLYNEDVVVYTPQGRPVTLPKGASALDFAFGIHTEIGEHALYARINGRLCSLKTVLKRGDSVEIGTDPTAHPKPDWLDAAVSYKARKRIRGYLKKQPHPKYALCPHCHPLPGSEIIGFRDAEGKTTVHSRGCAEAIRIASEQGNTIVSIDDFLADPAILYPVKIVITGVDRYHLLTDIIDYIVEDHHLSMTALCTDTQDDIVTCTIGFAVHSAQELLATIRGISSLDGVEEVRSL